MRRNLQFYGRQQERRKSVDAKVMQSLSRFCILFFVLTFDKRTTVLMLTCDIGIHVTSRFLKVEFHKACVEWFSA